MDVPLRNSVSQKIQIYFSVFLIYETLQDIYCVNHVVNINHLYRRVRVAARQGERALWNASPGVRESGGVSGGEKSNQAYPLYGDILLF